MFWVWGTKLTRVRYRLSGWLAGWYRQPQFPAVLASILCRAHLHLPRFFVHVNVHEWCKDAHDPHHEQEAAVTRILSANGWCQHQGWYCVVQASSSVFRRLHRRSASHPEELGATQRAGSGPLTAPLAKQGLDTTVVKRKKLLFVHFRINRVHCRVTYKVGLQSLPPHAGQLGEQKLWLLCCAMIYQEESAALGWKMACACKRQVSTAAHHQNAS